MGEMFAILVFSCLVIGALVVGQKKLENPNNSEIIYTMQMASVCQLGDGPVEAALVRQSGNLYRELGVFDDWRDAIAEIEKAFNRAKIDSVAVQSNTPLKFECTRLVYNHRGRAEGKKLGGAIVVAAS
ncbi:hypothetical protein [Roseovarius sp. TM1035]|jgi:hypothetical protein|uniref:hypothetical protein n=1 Tax=Roseovarius sp. TM1035 TaxID=391613 RepID=UPI00055BB125|nr:hypothetical protein [Roseovarius sp. TM1035]